MPYREPDRGAPFGWVWRRHLAGHLVYGDCTAGDGADVAWHAQHYMYVMNSTSPFLIRGGASSRTCISVFARLIKSMKPI